MFESRIGWIQAGTANSSSISNLLSAKTDRKRLTSKFTLFLVTRFTRREIQLLVLVKPYKRFQIRACSTLVRAATCPSTRAIDRSSHVDCRSILVLTSLANTRAGQSEGRIPPAPFRTPEWSSHLSGQRRILYTLNTNTV